MTFGRELGTPVGEDGAVTPDARLVDDWKMMVEGSHIVVSVLLPVGVTVSGACSVVVGAEDSNVVGIWDVGATTTTLEALETLLSVAVGILVKVADEPVEADSVELPVDSVLADPDPVEMPVDSSLADVARDEAPDVAVTLIPVTLDPLVDTTEPELMVALVSVPLAVPLVGEIVADPISEVSVAVPLVGDTVIDPMSEVSVADPVRDVELGSLIGTTVLFSEVAVAGNVVKAESDTPVLVGPTDNDPESVGVAVGTKEDPELTEGTSVAVERKLKKSLENVGSTKVLPVGTDSTEALPLVVVGVASVLTPRMLEIMLAKSVVGADEDNPDETGVGVGARSEEAVDSAVDGNVEEGRISDKMLESTLVGAELETSEATAVLDGVTSETDTIPDEAAALDGSTTTALLEASGVLVGKISDSMLETTLVSAAVLDGKTSDRILDTTLDSAAVLDGVTKVVGLDGSTTTALLEISDAPLLDGESVAVLKAGSVVLGAMTVPTSERRELIAVMRSGDPVEAAAELPALPVNETPEGSGVVVGPSFMELEDVTTPPGPKVIALPEEDAADSTESVVDVGVGKTMTAGMDPVDATEESGVLVGRIDTIDCTRDVTGSNTEDNTEVGRTIETGSNPVAADSGVVVGTSDDAGVGCTIDSGIDPVDATEDSGIAVGASVDSGVLVAVGCTIVSGIDPVDATSGTALGASVDSKVLVAVG